MSTNKPQYTLLHHFAIEGLCVASYTVKSPFYRKAFFATIAAAVTHALFFTNLPGVSGHSPFTDQFIGMRLASLVIFASVDLLIRDPQREYRHIGDKDDIPQRSFLHKMWWGFQISVNPRGVNWTYELTSALPPKPQHKSRLHYAAFAIRDILVLSLLNEVHCLVSHLNPYFDPGVPKIEGNQWLWRLYTCGFALGLKWIITLEVRLASLACMALGFTRPEDWPSPMGPVSDAYTVGRFWGKCWHSNYRRAFVEHAKIVNRKLGLARGSLIADTLGLSIIFFLSAVIHFVGEYAIFGNLQAAKVAFYFFLWQVPAILFENAVMAVAHRAGVKQASWWTYLVGYLWVFAWGTAVLPSWIFPHYSYGYRQTMFPYGSALLNIWGRLQRAQQ